MARSTTMTAAVQLTEPIREKPRPAPGCDVCAALARQWAQAVEAGSPAYDPSHATDLAVEIQRHPHGRHQ